MGRRTTKLDVSHAFHSPHMEGMLEAFLEVARGCTFHPPQIPIVSNETGRVAPSDELMSPEYWGRHVRGAVRFLGGMKTLEEEGVRTFVECGPRGVLCGMGAGCVEGDGHRFIASHRKGRPEAKTAMTALCEVHVAGGEVDWSSVGPSTTPGAVELPPTAFVRERYWQEPSGASARSAVGTLGTWPLAGEEMMLPGGGALHVLNIGPGVQGYLGDHQVYGQIVVPGAFYVAVMMSIAANHWPDQAVEVREVQFVEALWFDDPRERVPLHVHLQPTETDFLDVTLAASRDGVWTTHATARIGVAETISRPEFPVGPDHPLHRVEDGPMLKMLGEFNIDWGSRWVWLEEVGETEDARVGHFKQPKGVPLDSPVPGGLLDNSFSIPFLQAEVTAVDKVPRLPFGIDRLVWMGRSESIAWVTGDPRSVEADVQVGDLAYWNERGELLARIEGFTARRAPKSLFLRGATLPLYHPVWQGAPEPSADAEVRPVVMGGDGSLARSLGVPHVEDLSELSALSESPTHVLVDGTVPLEGDLVSTVSTHLENALEQIVEWLADETTTSLELVWVTRDAVRDSEGAPGALVLPAGGVVRLRIVERGRLDRLGFAVEERAALPAGHVRVETRAVGLNFRFIIDALGLFPGDAGPLGGDAAGVVTETGDGVSHLAKGDRVLGLIDAVSECVVDASRVIRVPEALSFEEAATLPIAMITVLYGLRDLGELKSGERVLIHAAAGGVGMVALQYAKHVGAEVFATASEPKWDALRALGIDDAHIASSRDANFLERFRTQTGGEGVDVVLNSLAGELTDASLALMKPGGRFLEMGKTDLRDPGEVASAFPGVTYTVFDIMPLILGEPDRIFAMLGAAVAGLESGWLKPLPVQTFPWESSPEAFRFMAQARHIGKVVLTLGGEAIIDDGEDGLVGLSTAPVQGLLRTARHESPDRRIRLLDLGNGEVSAGAVVRALQIQNEPELRVSGEEVRVSRLRKIVPDSESGMGASLSLEGTLLLTGGTGALGRLMARYLVREKGAEHLVLTSRRGEDAPGMAELRSELLDLGAQTVRVVACDVTVAEEVVALVEDLVAERPLRGVIHLAGVLDDGVVKSMSSERLRRVLAPKVAGAWHLHEATKNEDLSLFVLFSSVGGLFGNPGQGNYAAANVFLDALAVYRRRRGLVGTSLAWGAWAGEGMLETLTEADQQRIRRSGLTPLSGAQGLELFEDALLRPEPVLLTANLNLKQMERQAVEGTPVPWLFRALVTGASSRGAAEASAAARALRELLGGLPEEEREEALLEAIATEVAAVLGLSSGDEVDPATPLQEMGADSLMAIELYNRLSALSGTTLPSTLVFDYPNVGAITGFILSRMELPGEEEVSEPGLKEALLEAIEKASLEELQGLGTLEALRELVVSEPEAPAAVELSPEAREMKRLEEAADAASEDELLEMLESSLDDWEED